MKRLNSTTITKRTQAITLIAVYMGIIGFILILSTINDLVNNQLIAQSFFDNSFLIQEIMILIIGTVSLAMVYGLLKMIKWAWGITIVLNLVLIILIIGYEIRGDEWSLTSLYDDYTIGANDPTIERTIRLVFLLAINVGIICYFLKPQVKSLFG